MISFPVPSRLASLLLAVVLVPALVSSADIPDPAELLGFRPGSDRQLMDYDQLVGVMQRAADAVCATDTSALVESAFSVGTVVSTGSVTGLDKEIGGLVGSLLTGSTLLDHFRDCPCWMGRLWAAGRDHFDG